jgi:hypothetical protein
MSILLGFPNLSIAIYYTYDVLMYLSIVTLYVYDIMINLSIAQCGMQDVLIYFLN